MTYEQLDALREHTPGPWVRNDKWEIVSKGAGIVCRMQPWDVSGCRIDDNANADLIAAAPSLLAHIEELQRKLTADRDELLDVIRKIEGQRDRLRDEMRRYLPVLGALEAKPLAWEMYTDGAGIATLNGYRKALKEVDNDNT